MYAAATPPTELFTDRFQCWPDDTDPLYMDDMDDPIPLEDRGAAPTPEIDAERIASRDPEAADRSAAARRVVAGSFNNWMRQTFMEEEAARKIQLFVRPRLPTTLSTPSHSDDEHEPDDESDPVAADKSDHHTAAAMAAAMRATDTTLSFASVDVEDDEQDDEDALQYEVFLWHGSYLGLEFYQCNMTGYPCVEDPNGNDSLPGMWNLRQGDYLVSINDCSTHQDEMPFDSVVQILEDGVRPAILRFRRPRIQEVRYRSSLVRMSQPTRRGSFQSAKKEVQRRRERLERSLCYVVWREEDGPLGIALKPERNKPYPTVSEVNPSGVVARESDRNPIKAGDLLLSINHMDVSAMGYRQSLEIMKFAPRPLVLTFRRSSPDYPVARSLEL